MLTGQVLTRALLCWRGACARDLRVHGKVRLHGAGRIELGDGVLLDAATAPIELCAHAGAVLSIGAGAIVESGASIEAARSVRLGRSSRIGAFAKIIDSHYHPLSGDRGKRPAPGEVAVDDGAVIGPRAILLPGARVMAGAWVPAGATVRRRFTARAEP